MRTKLTLTLVFLFACSCSSGQKHVEVHIVYSCAPCAGCPGDTLDTVRGTYRRAAVGDYAPITIELRLTEEERERIYQKAQEVGFFKLPKEVVAPSERIQTIKFPCSYCYLWIERGRSSHAVKWETCTQPDPEALRELSDLIWTIVRSKYEYKRLPIVGID